MRYRDSACSISEAMNEAIDFFANGTGDVFLGPTCDYAAAPVARQVGIMFTSLYVCLSVSLSVCLVL